MPRGRDLGGWRGICPSYFLTWRRRTMISLSTPPPLFLGDFFLKKVLKWNKLRQYFALKMLEAFWIPQEPTPWDPRLLRSSGRRFIIIHSSISDKRPPSWVMPCMWHCSHIWDYHQSYYSVTQDPIEISASLQKRLSGVCRWLAW